MVTIRCRLAHDGHLRLLIAKLTLMYRSIWSVTSIFLRYGTV